MSFTLYYFLSFALTCPLLLFSAGAEKNREYVRRYRHISGIYHVRRMKTGFLIPAFRTLTRPCVRTIREARKQDVSESASSLLLLLSMCVEMVEHGKYESLSKGE